MKVLKSGAVYLKKLGPFFSLFLMRKPLSKVQEWFLGPYFPLIGGIFVLKIGLRFSFRVRVRKRPLSPSQLPFLHSQIDHWNKNHRPLFNTNIPPISGKYGLRNHFWSLESGFLMRKREENDFFSKICNNSILRFTYLKSAQNFWLFCISTFFGLLQAR